MGYVYQQILKFKKKLSLKFSGQESDIYDAATSKKWNPLIGLKIKTHFLLYKKFLCEFMSDSYHIGV